MSDPPTEDPDYLSAPKVECEFATTFLRRRKGGSIDASWAFFTMKGPKTTPAEVNIDQSEVEARRLR